MLISCRHCQNPVAEEAESCPHCGGQPYIHLKAPAVVIVAFALMAQFVAPGHFGLIFSSALAATFLMALVSFYDLEKRKRALKRN